MSFIRLQRKLPDYNPNTRHCFYGADADLIILALATHEIHICILREDVLKPVQTEICLSTFLANSSQKEVDVCKSRQWFKKFESVSDKRTTKKKPFQFLNIWILREYLEIDMKPRLDADIERIVDDFIFICLFAGNDFLPHVPSIEIHENGIDLLIDVYQKMFKSMSMGDYLIDLSKINKKNTLYINFKGFKSFMTEIGAYENKIFEKRYNLRQKKLQRLMQQREKDENDRITFCNLECNAMQEDFNCSINASEHISDSFAKKCNISSSSAKEEASFSTTSNALENTRELKRRLKQFLSDKADLFKNEVLETDKVKLGCPGWKTRYYKGKFFAENVNEIEAIRMELVKKYFEGLCWVLQYYFIGICSWSWYYPFYYGPFASDFKDLSCANVTFAIGRPFMPFDQLMAVLPPRSSHALPEVYRSLMTDDNSPIVHFYPNDFVEDNDGKRYTWQGVCKLPFIEEQSLLAATKALLKELQPGEIERNCVKSDKLFFLDLNSLVKELGLQYQLTENHPKENHDAINTRFGIKGFLSSPSNFISPILGMNDISNDTTRCATLIKQELDSHLPRPLEGVAIPDKTITDIDIVARLLWHEYPGHFPPQLLQQRVVHPQRNSSMGGFGVGRGKAILDGALIGSSKEIRKGGGQGWGGVGRGKEIVDRTPVGGGGRGWGSMGRGRPIVLDREQKLYPVTHWNVKDNKGSNRSTNGWGECSAGVPASTSKLYGDSVRRSDDWRQRSSSMVSAYGRGMQTTASRGRGRQDGRGWKGDDNFMWSARRTPH